MKKILDVYFAVALVVSGMDWLSTQFFRQEVWMEEFSLALLIALNASVAGGCYLIPLLARFVFLKRPLETMIGVVLWAGISIFAGTVLLGPFLTYLYLGFAAPILLGWISVLAIFYGISTVLLYDPEEA